MKIAFYGQPLLTDNKTGIGYCEEGLVCGLLRGYPENEYFADVFTPGKREETSCIRAYGDIGLHECKYISERMFKVISLILEIPYHWLFPQKRDITHFFNYVIPFGVKGKKVVTVYDLTFLEYPETVRGRTMLMLKRHLKHSIRRADAIIAISDFTKGQILKYYDISPDKIYMVPCGIDSAQYHMSYEENQITKVKKKYGIEGEYFLYLGTLEPRKNIVGLLRAYEKFYHKWKERGEIPRLVLAGGKGWMYDDIFRTAEEISLGDHILFTGYVDEEDKPCLMKGASVFCFPSFYEGFGMPPLEAMACGTPVLTSNTSSLAEVTGEAAVQVDPYDIEAMADAMYDLYRDHAWREQLRCRGLEQAKKYSWESAAEKLERVYESVVD